MAAAPLPLGLPTWTALSDKPACQTTQLSRIEGKKEEPKQRSERKEGKKEDRKTEEGEGRLLSGLGDTQRSDRNTKHDEKKLMCDVLTGIPASKATEGSEGKLWARGSLPQRHIHTFKEYQCLHVFDPTWCLPV